MYSDRNDSATPSGVDSSSIFVDLQAIPGNVIKTLMYFGELGRTLVVGAARMVFLCIAPASGAALVVWTLNGLG